MTQKRFLLALVWSAFSILSISAQNLFQKSYHRAFSEQVLAVETQSNGHVVMAGYTIVAANGQKDMWISRVNASGDLVWSKTYTLGQSSSATALKKTSDGNLLVAYNTTGSSISANASGWMKIGVDGNVIWSKKAIGNSVLNNISPIATGGYLLCGQSFTAAGTQASGLVVKITENGDLLWASVFGENGSSAVTDCWEDGLGLIHCCGYTSDTGGKKNGFWAKLNGEGEHTGPVRRYGSADHDELTRIVPMGTNRLLMSGYTLGFNNSPYAVVWTVVIDYDGALKSSKTFALAENNLIVKDMIAVPGDQYLLALGNQTGQLSPAILMKLSVDLDQLFACQYKGGSESDVFAQVLKTSAGFTAAGTTSKNGDSNAYLVTTDVEGRLNNDDCCPYQLEILRKDVSPETAAFVPTQTAFYAVQNATLTTTAQMLTINDLCQQIDLDFSLSQDTICPGECVEIIVVDSTLGVQYTFEYQGGMENPDKPGQICHTDGPVLFITRKGNNGACVHSLTKRVNLGGGRSNFPNAFTPNGDGANDVFKPVFGCVPVSVHFQVYNRWGKKLFETRDVSGGWDGRADGIEAASDVYVWMLTYQVENNGALEQLSERGEVTLLR